MLFNKPLAEIEERDLQALIDNQVSEKRTIEYKSVLPGNTDSEKKEFLADVSSFANASGGDLIYGIKEQAGIPIALSGLQLDDVDAEILRLENSIRTGIAPRLPRVEVHAVPLPSKPQRYTLIIRVHQSFLSPHMVTFKNDSKFFTRTSRGKDQLDVSELRTAFVFSETIVERIRAFRTERLSRISAGVETPASLNEQEAKLVLHLVPLSTFGTALPLDLKSLSESFHGKILDKGKLLEPLSVWSTEQDVRMRFNLDGLARSTRGGYNATSTIGYTQVFRNGSIETVDMSLLGINAQNVARSGSNVDPKSFSGEIYERKLLEAIKRYITLLKFLGVEPPLFIMVSFLGVKGYKIAIPKSGYVPAYTGEIDRNNLIIPDVMIETLDVDLAEVMRPIFDTVWNAAGYIASPNYDAEGKFAFGY